MYQEFDKDIMIDNLYYLVKKKNLKVGELEKDCGVSAGYISRTRSESKSKPSIELVMKMAEALGVSIDTLVRYDITLLTTTEQYLLEFLEKLIKDTQDDKLTWNTGSSDSLNMIDENHDINDSEVPDYPLFSVQTFFEESDCEYPDKVTRTVFQSHTFGNHTCINNDCFNIRLKNGTILYLMDFVKTVHYVKDTTAYGREIWMCAPTASKQFICSNRDDSPLAGITDQLYMSVSENCRHPRIQNNMRNAIDSFMKDDIEDDPVDIDDVLPFT